MSALVLPRRRLDSRPDDLAWDDGRLMIKQSFAELFDGHSLTSFSSLMNQPELASAKAARKDRLTYRFELSSPAGVRVFYLKWHGRAPWKDYVKPWLQGKTAIVGAWNEWQAMHHFEAAGVSSMKPVAYGEHHAESFVIIEGLEGYTKLSDLLKRHPASAFYQPAIWELVDSLAVLTARMHDANLHHQDYYLGHVMVKSCYENCLLGTAPITRSPDLRIIDLGRAQKQNHLARRWIVKDLAQLDYSGRDCPQEWRSQFWETYCRSRNEADETGLRKAVESKAVRIASHSRKHKI
jgi:tRNA A-37 threonylcarbamoyl transferase component Bud32